LEAIDCGADLCFSPNVFFLQRGISELRKPTGVKFCRMVSIKLSFIMPVQNFGGPSLEKLQGPKTCKI